MKKIISVLLALALSASLCACGNTDTNDTEDTSTSAEPTETTTVETESAEDKALNATQVRYEKAKECLTEYLNDGYDNECTITYSYYENGDLKEKDVKDYKSVSNFTSVYTCAYEYTYDVNGYLVMKKENNTIVDRYYESQTSTQFLYTNDENGRPVSAELIETVDGKNSYASQILTYNYETLYFYDAE